MLDADLFACGEVVERKLNIGGKEVTMHFRELPAVEFQECFVDQEDSALKVLSPALLISKSLRNPDGSPAITAERAAQLKNAPFNAIFRVIMELNGEGAAGNASPSAGKTGSGTR